MNNIVEQRERYRLAMLKALYDATNAGAMLGITATKFYDLMVDLDIPKNEVESARTWLERRGFVTSPAINYIGITHAGIAAYTESRVDRLLACQGRK